jgi:glycine oxidase
VPYPDVLIAGGGIIGCSIAWRLAQQGCRVTIADAGRLGGEASWAGAGMLAPGGEIDRDSPWARRSVESLKEYPAFVGELREESGLAIDFRSCGALELAYEPYELRDANLKAEQQLTLGIPSELVDVRTAASRVPEVSMDGLVGARYYPEDSIVDPREIVGALRTVLERRGVEIREGQAVEQLPSGVTVLAAGAWSSAIVPTVRRAFPVKGHLVGYDLGPGTVPTILRHAHTYILQRSNGFTIAGSTTEDAGFDHSVDPRIVARLHDRARRYLPRLLRASPDASWSGLRPAVDGDEPQVGRMPGSDLWLAYGHYRNGILLAPLTARLITAGILNS